MGLFGQFLFFNLIPAASTGKSTILFGAAALVMKL